MYPSIGFIKFTTAYSDPIGMSQSEANRLVDRWFKDALRESIKEAKRRFAAQQAARASSNEQKED